MINLLNFAAENSRVNKLISNVSEIKGHQGTVIRFADDFLTLFNYWKSDSRNFRYLLDYYFDFFERRRFRGGFMSNDFLNRLGSSYPLNTFTKNIDFSEWNRFNDDVLKRYPRELLSRHFRPLELIISIFNDADPRKFDKAIRNYNEGDNNKNNIPEFRVIIEKRRRNVFLSGSRRFHPKMVGGISISNNSKKVGTLGGILTDSNGKYYGLTCAHVTNLNNEDVFQPALSDSKKYRKFGNVKFSSNINWTDDNSPCNPRYIGRLGQNENMDTTLISIDSNVLTTGFRKKLVVGGICVSYKVAYEGEGNEEDRFACFTNLIELRTPAPIMNAGNFHIQRSPVAHGDSGSWICSNDRNGYNWCGMLISGDVDRGYFLAAEDIQNHLRNNSFDLNCSRINTGNPILV